MKEGIGERGITWYKTAWLSAAAEVPHIATNSTSYFGDYCMNQWEQRILQTTRKQKRETILSRIIWCARKSSSEKISRMTSGDLRLVPPRHFTLNVHVCGILAPIKSDLTGGIGRANLWARSFFSSERFEQGSH